MFHVLFLVKTRFPDILVLLDLFTCVRYHELIKQKELTMSAIYRPAEDTIKNCGAKLLENINNKVTIMTAFHHAYNMVDEIKVMIDSVVETTLQPFEFVIVDNAAPDETKKFLYSINDSRIKVITNPSNRGFSGGINAAINHSSTDFWFWVDGDKKLLTKDWTRNMAVALQEGSVYGFFQLWCCSRFIADEVKKMYKSMLPEIMASNSSIKGKLIEYILNDSHFFDENIMVIPSDGDMRAGVEYAGFRINYLGPDVFKTEYATKNKTNDKTKPEQWHFVPSSWDYSQAKWKLIYDLFGDHNEMLEKDTAFVFGHPGYVRGFRILLKGDK